MVYTKTCRMILVLMALSLAGPSRCLAEDNEPLLPIAIDNKVGFINTRGQLVVPPKLDGAMPLVSNRLAVAQVEGRYGFINRKGELVIPAKYDRAKRFACGMAPVKVGEQWHYIDENGDTVLTGPYQAAFRFLPEGVTSVKIDDKYTLIDTKGQRLTGKTFPLLIPMGAEGLIAARLPGNKWGYLSLKGEIVIATDYVYGRAFSNGLAAVATKDQTYGYIDRDGNTIIEPRFPAAREFASNGLAAVVTQRRQGPYNYYGFINKEGEWVIPPRFFHAYDFVCGLAPVQDPETKAFGYIDETGEVVIAYRFARAMNFSKETGLAMVYIDEANTNWIDQKGRLLWKGEQAEAEADGAPANADADGDASVAQ